MHILPLTTSSMVSVTSSCGRWMQQEARLPGSQMDSLVSLLSETCILVFYDKEGRVLINLHIFSVLCWRQNPHTPLLCDMRRIIFAPGIPCYSRGPPGLVFLWGEETSQASVFKTLQEICSKAPARQPLRTNSHNHPDLPQPTSSGEEPKQMLLFKA